MVAPAGAASSVDRLRPLNRPRPVEVEVAPGHGPVALSWRGRRLAVERILDRWRIDEEWWRAEIARLYYQILLANGHLLTVFCDLREGGWYLQHAGAPRQETPLVLVTPRYAPPVEAPAVEEMVVGAVA